MLVSDVMTRGVFSCTPSHTLKRAAELMAARNCGWVPVVDEEGRVIGVVTDRDICMAALRREERLGRLSVMDAMSEPVVGCSVGDTLDHIVQLMRQNHVRRMPVLHANGQLEGLISLTDIALCLAENGQDGSLVDPWEVASLLADLSRPHFPKTEN